MRAADGGYLRANAIQVIPEAADSDATTGVLVAFGLAFDNIYSDSAQEIEFEVGYAGWDYSESGVIGSLSYTAKADLTFIPLLFTYRYQWKLSDRLSLAIGPSAGMIFVRASGSGSAGSASISVADNDWIFTYGAGAQLNYKVSDAVTVNLGYRYLFNQEASFSIAGIKAKLTDLDTHVVEAGLRFDWPY